MGYLKYSYSDLKNLCTTAFEKFGCSKEDSETITDVLLLSDLFGIESHGMQRIVRYYNGIKNGIMKVDAEIETVHETMISAVLDAHGAMGQVVGKKAMELAIEKAKKTGIGLVTVRNSNHYGIAGYYSKMAEKEGMLGISMTNSEAITVPTFGREAMMGSNPLAISMPAKPYPFLLDMSTSVVTRGKVEVYNKNQKPLPIGWTLDGEGQDTDDAKAVLYNIINKIGGGILPLGGSGEGFSGHKGYGLAVAVEMFCAIFSGGVTSNYIHGGKAAGTCHFFLAADYGMFGDKESIENHMSKYLTELRESKKAAGALRIYTHGQKEMEAYDDKLENGILVNKNTLKEIEDMCNYLGINMADYLTEIK
ncbi:MAG: Ldh family oxidoreductase [Clostridiaceae bacterium]